MGTLSAVGTARRARAGAPWWLSLRWQLAIGLAGLWTLLSAGAGVWVYLRVARGLRAAMDRQLAVEARLLAARLGGALATAPGPAGTRDRVLEAALDGSRSAGLARDLAVLDSRGLVLIDATGDRVPGFLTPELGPDDWARLRAGWTLVHPPRPTSFGTRDQSVFTPLGRGLILQMLVDPAYLQVLAGFRRASLAAGALGLGLCLVLGAGLAAWLLSPLGWLEGALGGGPPPGRPGPGGHELSRALSAAAASLRSLTLANLEARLEKDHAESRSEEMRRVASAIAHEVRNPLTVIRGQADLLERALGPRPEAEGPLGHIRSQVARLERMVSRFLELGRVPKPDLREADLGALLERLAQDLRQTAGSAHEVEALSEEPRILRCDPALLEGALLNLGLNALQAMPAGGRVSLRLRHEGGDALLEVADQGPGVAPEARGRLFEPFFTTKAAGTGLGLALARRAAQAHGGDLEADAAPGGGALFRMRLPRGGT